MKRDVQAPPNVTLLTEAMQEIDALATDAEKYRALRRGEAVDGVVLTTPEELERLAHGLNALSAASIALGEIVASYSCEALDYRRCPRCGSEGTMERHRADPFASRQIGVYPMIRHCPVCAQDYRVEFRAVRVEAE